MKRVVIGGSLAFLVWIFLLMIFGDSLRPFRIILPGALGGLFTFILGRMGV